MNGFARTVLTEAQQRVVDHPLALPALVEAGAGTGKTFTIVERVAALHERGICRADRILLLTFARKAAAELRARIARRLGPTTPTCSTFHAFAWSVLFENAYDIGQSPDIQVLEDVEARVEFARAFDEYLADPSAVPSGFPLRPYNRDEIRRELFALDQTLKQTGVSLDAFERRALRAADAFARVPYRELRSPRARPKAGNEWKIEFAVTEAAFAQELAWERERVIACSDILRRFAGRLAARSALTYSDILVRAESALREHEPLRKRLARRYECCIVDEYQDTDPSQHRLLDALFGKNLASVMVVGDRLQSIFGFRGADPDNVAVFMRAPEATRYTLAENRRSHQEILDVAHASIRPSHADAQPLESRRGAAGKQIVHLTTRWEEDDEKHVPVELAREREAEAVARRVVLLLGGGATVDAGAGPEPISPRHIAILSRTKRNVQPVTDALSALHVPFKLVGGVGFYDAPEIRDTLAWMRLLANPFDPYAVTRALQSAAVGASDAEVARLAWGISADETAFPRRVLCEEPPAGDELAGQSASAARRLRALLEELAPQAAVSLGAALARVIEFAGIERAVRESSDPRRAQALANLNKLEALARSFVESMPSAQPSDFVSFIAEMENVDFDEREADVTSEEAVTISTIHAAKGLEWPFVFVLSVWPQLPNPPRLKFDEATGALLYGENPDGARSFHYQSVKLEADASGIVPCKRGTERAEEARLFYVALTRARDRLFVSGPRTHPSKAEPFGKPHPHLAVLYGVFQERGWPTDEPVPRGADPLPVRTDGKPGRGPARTTPGDGRSRLERTVRLAAPLSYSLIARYGRCPRQASYAATLRLPEAGGRPQRGRSWPLRVEGIEPAEAAPFDSLRNAGEYGSALHAALEAWALDRRAGTPPAHAGEYLRRAGQSLGVQPSPEQSARAKGALERVIANLERWQPLLVEASFTLDLGEEGRPLLVTGYLDLLALDEAGANCLLDYKTGDAAHDHALQLALYRLAAREVYGIEVARCLIGRIQDESFTLVAVEPAPEHALRRRILEVRDGLERCDDRARPGAWCWTCGYRNAPCRDYPSKTAKARA